MSEDDGRIGGKVVEKGRYGGKDDGWEWMDEGREGDKEGGGKDDG